MDRAEIMQQWDTWRKYIAGGGGGSWPRDAFEALLDAIDEEWEAKAKPYTLTIEEFDDACRKMHKEA